MLYYVSLAKLDVGWTCVDVFNVSYQGVTKSWKLTQCAKKRTIQSLSHFNLNFIERIKVVWQRKSILHPFPEYFNSRNQ